MPYAAAIPNLAEFQQELVGGWKNLDFGRDEHGHSVGGEGNPLSYNFMPLPQATDPDGYILKNFKYHERILFHNDNAKRTLTSTAVAPNRGGEVTQNVRALFYDQQVRFAEGPDAGMVVHEENGAWLWLPRFVQQPGPYLPAGATVEPVTDALQQPSDLSVAKQIAVPHGNSVLALGSFDTIVERVGKDQFRKSARISGSPTIPDARAPYPMPANPVPNSSAPPPLVTDLNADARYSTLRNAPGDFENPHPDYTRYPNRPLQQAVAIIHPDAYMHWRVTTECLNGGVGSVTNIPFEQRVADVTEYWADYWLLFKEERGRGKGPKGKGGKVQEEKGKYLAYTQTMLMKMKIKGHPEPYIFPHVTCNVLTFTRTL